MIAVDTTILVYAVGDEHPLRTPSRELVRLARDGLVRVTTTVEVIQEFAHVGAKRRARPEAVALAREYAVGLSPLLRPDRDDLFEGLELFEAVPGLGCCAAVLAATVRRRGWVLASADRSFGRVRDLDYLDPSSPTFVDDALAAG
ncbi:MAG: type II toxin-antitoxin system VapC family toxin [Acidimicrobiales bacterium]